MPQFINPPTDEEILRDIVEQMETGVLPWRRPWSKSANAVVVGSMLHGANRWPSNLRAPRVPYGIFNGTILLARASKCRYRTNLWVTSRVIDELGAKIVDNDPQPTAIQRFAEEYQDSHGPVGHARLVYNIDQVEECEKTLGLTFLERAPAIHEVRFKRSESLRSRLEKNRSLTIVHEADRAAYSPSWDVVMLPDILQFHAVGRNSDQQGVGEANYWATLWHEVIHWTGHPSRLNRDRHHRWGDKTYAFEELIAELGSAFLCAHLGVDGELQHESYLDSWCRALKQDSVKPLWSACRYASQAKEYVLDKQKPDSKAGRATLF